MLEIVRSQVDVAVGPPGLAHELARQELLGRRGVERGHRLGVATQKDRHAAAVRHVVGQLLPDGRGERLRVQQAQGPVRLQRLVGHVPDVDHAAVESGLARPAERGRRQGLGQEHRVAVGRTGRGQQHAPGRCDLDGEVPLVVAGQRVGAQNLDVALVGSHLEQSHLELDGLRPSGLEPGGPMASLLRLPFGVQQVQLDAPLGVWTAVRKLRLDPQRAAAR